MKIKLHLLFAFFLCIFPSFRLLSQVYYDNWPKTRSSNDRAIEKDSSRQISPDFVVLGSLWSHRIITYLFVNGTSDIADQNEKQAVRNGFAYWAAQTDLLFLEVCDVRYADIEIRWGTFAHEDPNPPCVGNACNFDGVGGILAHTFDPDVATLGATAGDIHFDDSETWTLNTRTGSSQPIDLETVAAHEIGHALGLDNTTVSGSLMLANYNGSHRYLGQDDINGIRSLYGNPGSYSFISGSRIICSAASNYTLSYLPTSCTVTWAYSTNLQFVSNGSNYISLKGIGNGTGWIEATIHSDCSTLVIPRYSVYIGTPTPSLTVHQISGQGEPFTVSFTASPFITGASNTYKWYVNNILTESHLALNEFERYIPCNQSISVKCCVSNSCGTSAFSSNSVVSNDCSGLKSIVLSPNPAAGDIQVNILPPSESDTTKSKLLLNSIETSISKSNPYLVNITDAMGSIVQSSKQYTDNFIIPISTFKNGNYILSVNDGNNIYQKQFIIKHE